MKELNDKYVDLLFDKDICMLHVKFHKYVPYDKLLRIFENSYKVIRVSKADKCLINFKGFTIQDNESADYINKVWFSTIKRLGVKFVAVVLQNSAFGKSSKKEHENAYIINGLVINNFYNETEAYKWMENTDPRKFVLNSMKLPG